jgi:D-serine deaminase-like pyridoxal phosphate-dependent protein
MTLNSAGSPTYTMHAAGTVANEVSVGSAFVKPTDFDLDTLQAHIPAAFIATPVLKTLEVARVPGLESLTGLRRFMDPNTQRAIFIHGGHWLAQPASPPGLQYSNLYGRSSNQELLTGSASVQLQPDDYVFFRPTQSEALFLQFGDLLVYENGEITERWPTFAVSA